jgi:diguanylate cyclase (GGDEF)-like protein
VHHKGEELGVTVSLGVACTAEEGLDPEVLLGAADQALYRAKANGRNRVEV